MLFWPTWIIWCCWGYYWSCRYCLVGQEGIFCARQPSISQWGRGVSSLRLGPQEPRSFPGLSPCWGEILLTLLPAPFPSLSLGRGGEYISWCLLLTGLQWSPFLVMLGSSDVVGETSAQPDVRVSLPGLPSVARLECENAVPGSCFSDGWAIIRCPTAAFFLQSHDPKPVLPLITFQGLLFLSLVLFPVFVAVLTKEDQEEISLCHLVGSRWSHQDHIMSKLNQVIK